MESSIVYECWMQKRLRQVRDEVCVTSGYSGVYRIQYSCTQLL